MFQKVVVAIDIGTEFTCFAHSLKHSFLQSTIVFEQWEGQEKGIIRSPAIIEYNDDYTKIIRWGTPVLQQLKNDPDNPNEDSEFPREICTFQVFNSEQEDNWLPPELSRKKLISDYLSEIQKVIVSTIQENWTGVKPSQETGVVFIVPDKWGPTYCNILSQCLLENRLLCDNKENIQFISRGKAIALNCLSENKGVLKYGDYFLIVEIDRDTINLTAREYMSENTLDEIHDRKGDFKENSSIEKRFLTSQGISNDISIQKNTNLKQIYQTQLQIQPNLESLIKRFQSTGKTTRTIELDSILPSLKELFLSLKNENLKTNLELNKWCIELDLKLIADLFDPLSDRLQRFINTKFKDEDEYIEYSVIFFVGNIFKCDYLVQKIKKLEFSKNVKICIVPNSENLILLNGALEFVQDNTLYPVLTSLLRRAF
ncbi:1926_t:CDS:2 [Funneliformis mosseae]|uniref:1926_t:CDS:1 n=1 Tax=Funneliformis mosseae TaxID=27381 RepID=A0A9N9B6J1_FUNMO|nr:1926_t:CDS:2 [Funneliformis mosseae]